MILMDKPLVERDRMADSLPIPGPETITSTSFRPAISIAFSAAFAAATCAAYGVDFLDPLKAINPEEDQDNTLPAMSVTVTIVLLNEAWI